MRTQRGAGKQGTGAVCGMAEDDQHGTGADYIIGTEKEIRELREEVKSLKRLADVEDIPGR